MNEHPDAGRRPERRLDELLSDPIVVLLMRSDGVAADEVRALIRSKRRELASARPRSPQAKRAGDGRAAQLAL